MKDKKNLLIAVLLIAVVAMSVGYAALSTTLTVNGTANIDVEWKVLFTDIQKSIPTGSTAEDETAPTCTATTCTFVTNLKKPGDEEIYTMTIENQGTIDAELSASNWSTTGSLVNGVTGLPTYAKYQVTTEPALNSTLAAKTGTTTVVVRVYWDESVAIPEGDATIDETLVLTGTYTYVQAD